MADYPPEGDPEHCTSCRKRAGLPTPEVEIVYEKPQVRERGQPCYCRHCKALRAEAS